MDNGTLILMLCIIAIMLSFALGYYFASTRAENQFYKYHALMAKAIIEKQNIKQNMNVSVRRVHSPEEFMKVLEELEKERNEESERKQ